MEYRQNINGVMLKNHVGLIIDIEHTHGNQNQKTTSNSIEILRKYLTYKVTVISISNVLYQINMTTSQNCATRDFGLPPVRPAVRPATAHPSAYVSHAPDQTHRQSHRRTIR